MLVTQLLSAPAGINSDGARAQSLGAEPWEAAPARSCGCLGACSSIEGIRMPSCRHTLHKTCANCTVWDPKQYFYLCCISSQLHKCGREEEIIS